MSKTLARKYVNVPLEDTQKHQVTIPQRALYPLVKFSFILFLLLAGIIALGLLQINMYNTLVLYRRDIGSLEEAIDSFLIKNEMLKLEVERLKSPSRLKEEGRRLNLQPSDRIVVLSED